VVLIRIYKVTFSVKKKDPYLFVVNLVSIEVGSNEAERRGIWTWINGEIIIGKCGIA
jgi:hypothetical protein